MFRDPCSLQGCSACYATLDSYAGHFCRYDQQIKQLQQEQRDIQKDSDSFGYDGHVKYIGNPDDRKLAVKHNKTLIEAAKASNMCFDCVFCTGAGHALIKHVAFAYSIMLLLFCICRVSVMALSAPLALGNMCCCHNGWGVFHAFTLVTAAMRAASLYSGG